MRFIRTHTLRIVDFDDVQNVKQWKVIRVEFERRIEIILGPEVRMISTEARVRWRDKSLVAFRPP